MQIRIAPSLGELEGHPNDVWGTSEYTNPNEPAVFMGLYSLNDFNVLRNHKGKRYIFWCGSDIRHFLNGYWLDENGKHKVTPAPLAHWINEHCESWVENIAEYNQLNSVGINSHICPSFMGNVNDFTQRYSHSYTPQVYASVSGNDFFLYRWPHIEKIAPSHPEVTFHLYGNTVPWETKNKNVIVHGRIPKEQMNSEVQHMQGAIRLLPLDGFSEVIAKSLLWGQWPISFIGYPHTMRIDEISSLKLKFESNTAGRDWLLESVNKFPWVGK